MRSLTRNVGTTQLVSDGATGPLIEIKRVLICRPNHRLGNLLLITPLVQEIENTFPDCKIDLFIKGGLGPIVFKNYKNVDRFIVLPKKPFNELVKYAKVWMSLKKHKYDIAINIAQSSSSGRISAQFSNSKYKFFGDDIEEIQSKYDDYVHMAKSPVYYFRYCLDKLGYKGSDNPIPSLNLKLSAVEIAEGQKALKQIVDNGKKTISIFTFATGEKCYSESWWEIFYGRLLKEYPDYNIIEILPVENVSQIGFKAATFYSKDIREMGALIANTEVFIGADSGIVHLASASQTPTVGLFSVTQTSIYEPYGNKNIAINTNTTTIDEWITIVNGILNKD